MDILEHEGVSAVKIERLAKALKTSRSGFYWHFQDSAELLREMLEYWRLEYAEVVIKNGQLGEMDPAERLYIGYAND